MKLPFRLPVRSLLALLYGALALVAALQAVTLTRQAETGQDHPTKYNNYLIFKASHDHLLHGQNLYAPWPGEHADLFKYSPTFALFFGFFGWFPDAVGLSLWNLLNAAVFLVGVWLLPGLSGKGKNLVLLLAAVDAMTSLQNSQSNLLVAGLLLLALALLERRAAWAATLCIALTFYIKIFGVFAFFLVFFYPSPAKNLLRAACWMVVMALLPVAVTGFGPLVTHYRQYLDLLRSDHSASLGFSVMGWLKGWFGLDTPKTIMTLAGLAVLIPPLFFPGRFREFSGRALWFAALLVWMVIFNHKAESPTFIIATAPIFLWIFSRPLTPLTAGLLLLTLVFTTLAPTDLFPATLRRDLFVPYVVKAVPCILAWGVMVGALYAPLVASRKKVT